LFKFTITGAYSNLKIQRHRGGNFFGFLVYIHLIFLSITLA